MNNNIKMAFEQIHANNTLKEKTKTAIYSRTNGYEKAHRTVAIRFVSAAACVLVLLLTLGGYFSYTIPVAAISLDVNPSVELQINLYDRVIDVKGYNEDGIALANELSVKNMNYADAVNLILENEKIVSCIASDELLEVTVTSNSPKREKRLQSCLSAQTHISPENIYCSDHYEDVEVAHSAGISFGKYRAYLELCKIAPDITVEDIRDLTMREIRKMIEGHLHNTPNSDIQESVQGNGHGNGSCKGNGNGKHTVAK